MKSDGPRSANSEARQVEKGPARLPGRTLDPDPAGSTPASSTIQRSRRISVTLRRSCHFGRLISTLSPREREGHEGRVNRDSTKTLSASAGA